MVSIRLAQAADLDLLAQYWYERAVLTPPPPGLTLAPDARAQWRAAATGWLSAADHCLLVALADERPVGFAAGRVAPAPVGFGPQPVGEVLGLALEGHAYHAGAGRTLADALRSWFRAQGVTHVRVTVPRSSPVEQAFWRALRGTAWMETLWLTW